MEPLTGGDGGDSSDGEDVDISSSGTLGTESTLDNEFTKKPLGRDDLRNIVNAISIGVTLLEGSLSRREEECKDGIIIQGASHRYEPDSCRLNHTFFG